MLPRNDEEPEKTEPFVPLTKPPKWNNMFQYLNDYVDWEMLTRTRTVFLYEEMDSDVAFSCVRKLTFLASISKKPIRLVINSVGGEVYCGLMVYDTIRNLISQGIEVICEARGLAASMGAIVLQAGSKRLATKCTRILIHEITSLTWGRTSEQEEQVKELIKLNAMLNQIIGDKTGKTADEIEKLCKKKEVWFSAEEAKEFGLVDEVI